MQPCPRMREIGNRTTDSGWREDGTCSYCGSLSPEMLWAAIADGAELGPTDKNYKVYVAMKEARPEKPRVTMSTNYELAPEIVAKEGWIRPADVPADVDHRPEPEDTWCKWVKVEPRGPIRHTKFYFQHFTLDDRRRFIEMMNAKTLKIGTPGYFYRLPFFAQPATDVNSN